VRSGAWDFMAPIAAIPELSRTGAVPKGNMKKQGLTKLIQPTQKAARLISSDGADASRPAIGPAKTGCGVRSTVDSC
jgi:hypothetical protein